MAKGVFNSIMGLLWARRILWVMLAWVGLNLVFYPSFAGLNNLKFMGISHILPRIYGGVLGLYAIDVYRKAV